MPSLAQSFKMSSPLNEVGTLVQDRQSCIIGDLDARSTMLPIDVRVSGPGVEPRRFHAEVARNRRLTPMLASMVVSNAIADAEPDVTDMVVTVTSKVGVKGHAPLELRDQIFSPEGVSGRALAMSRGLRAMGELLFNPFEPVVLDRIDVDVRVEFRRDVAEIIGVSLPGQEVHAGDTVPLRVTLRPYAGPEYVETVPVVIPRTVAGEVIKIEVASGALVRPDVAAGGVAARLHRQHAQVLRRLDHRGDAADPGRGRVAARAADPGAARVGDGHAAPLQPDQARRLLPRSPIAPCSRRSSSSAASKSCRSSSSRTFSESNARGGAWGAGGLAPRADRGRSNPPGFREVGPGRRKRPASLTIAAPACAPSRSCSPFC